MIKIENIKNFNLKDTITCGQIFRYFIENDDSYTIIIKDRVVNVKYENNILSVKSNNEDKLKEIILNYFDLNRDYNDINKYLINKDKKMKNIINKCNGLKMIRQDPFETLIEYMISANNRIPSIKNSLNLISEKYGKKIIFENKDYYLFPTSNDLKDITIEEFKTFKVGFRDKRLFEIIKSINNKELNLNIINNMNTNDALNYLMNYNGIGPKVASCILLFAYQRFDVFPVDTWVKKYMEEEYNIIGQSKIIEFAKNNYDKYSAIAIQYMFHSKRNIK